ncbi:Endonuclease/exonuclease/phosphatase [Amylocystis lapponica]|nr:Endonuclease/exonuclease/phosphatase [Amylocystis lapponica]
MSETHLRVLTLNCWGLKYVSKYRAERLAAIADALAASDYDIITLQEVWVFADYELIRAAVSKQLLYAKFFYSGALGAGLAIVSRFPIIGATIHPYSLNGSPIDVIQGDWFVGKAAASVLVAHPILGQLQVFNTHLFAPGGDSGPSHQQAHRLVNAWELAKLTRQAAEGGRYVISAGDLNSTPASLPLTIIRDHAGLADAWAVSHPTAPPPGIPTPDDAIRVYGVTADSPLNSYSAGKRLEPIARKFQGKRLDYILYRQPSSPPAVARTPRLTCTDSRVVFTENVPGRDFSFSDHFGLEATFEISLPTGGDVTDPAETYIPAPASPQSPSFVLNSVPNPQATAPRTLSADSITSILQSLTACYRYALHRSKYHLTVFAFSILLLIVMVVGSAWLPHSWVNSIFTLLIVFVAWLATTMLYANALTNVIEELEIYKLGLAGSQNVMD